MTRLIKLGRQRIIFCRSAKVRTEIYRHLSRDDATLILGIAPYQAGIMFRFPKWFSHAILMLKWSYPGRVLLDFCDTLRWKYRMWRMGEDAL
jgi:hypothetical protein